MASNLSYEFRLTECAVCHEEFKRPKLLPCSHSYCLDCIKLLKGQELTFLCPECRSETTVPERGPEAFPDNRYVDETIRLMKSMDTVDVCPIHKKNLVLFCENQKCQQQICAECAHAVHKDHQITNLASKAERVREKMAERKVKAMDVSQSRDTYLQYLDKVEEQLKLKTTEKLGEIDQTRKMLHQRIAELHKQIQERTEEHKMKVLKIQNVNLDALGDKRQKIHHNKTQLESFTLEIERSIKCLSDNALVQNDDTVDRVFSGLCEEEISNMDFNLKFQEVNFEKPDLSNQLMLSSTGTLKDVEVTFQPSKPLAELLKDVN